MPGSEFSITTADECPEQFDRVLVPLVTRLLESTYDPAKTDDGLTRRNLKDVLNRKKNELKAEKLSSADAEVSRYIQSVRASIAEYPTMRELLEKSLDGVPTDKGVDVFEAMLSRSMGYRTNFAHRLRNRINHIQKKDRREVLVARDGENVIGMVAFEYTPEQDLRADVLERLGAKGKPFFELGSVVVLNKAYENRGIAGALRKAALDAIRQKAPDAMVFSMSKNTKIHKKHEAEKHKLIDLKDSMLVWGMEDGEQLDEIVREMQGNHWQAYLFPANEKENHHKIN